jgi:hypothetical protein
MPDGADPGQPEPPAHHAGARTLAHESSKHGEAGLSEPSKAVEAAAGAPPAASTDASVAQARAAA